MPLLTLVLSCWTARKLPLSRLSKLTYRAFISIILILIVGFSLFASIHRPLAAETRAPGDPGTISGTVFRDKGLDGKKEADERGVANITVTAYDSDGTVAATATTGADGTYEIAGLTDGTEYRVEFSGLPSHLKSGPVGADNGSSLVLVTSPATEINFGIHNPALFCQTNPLTGIACYENGNGENNTNPGFVGFGYFASGIPAQYSSNYSSIPKVGENPVTLADIQTQGTVWGAAFQRSTRRLFNAAFLKRHVGVGPLGFGGVYFIALNPDDSVNETGRFDLHGMTPDNGGFDIDLGSVQRTNVSGSVATGAAGDFQLPQAREQPSRDLDAYDKVGKISFGGIDVDEDDRYLWLVNLNQQALIRIDILGPADSLPGSVEQYYLDPGQPASISGVPSCTGGVFRPWAIKIYEGRGYLGGVCNAETDRDTANLEAFVLSFDPAAPLDGFAVELTFPLDYNREKLLSTSNNRAAWRPWTNTWQDTGEKPAYPQPILSAIEFTDEGDMILGFMDRSSHQIGKNNYEPDSGSTTLVSSVSGGEILHVCRDNNRWIMEGENGCETNDLTLGDGEIDDDGPSGEGEYYFEDVYKFSDK